MLEVRDIVLGISEEAQTGQEDVTVGSGEEVHQVPEAVGADSRDKSDSETETEPEDEDSSVAGETTTRGSEPVRRGTQVYDSGPTGFSWLASRLEPGFGVKKATTATSKPVPGSAVSLENQERPQADSVSVAAVVVDALKAKRKVDAVDEFPDADRPRRQVRRRVVPTPTESQVERKERSRQDYEERVRERQAAGLSPLRPRRRTVLPTPRASTPSTQDIEEMFGLGSVLPTPHASTPSTQDIEEMFGLGRMSGSILSQSGFVGRTRG